MFRPYDALMSRPIAAFFDLDKTIIAKSSALAFSREFQAGGLITRRAMLRSAYAQFVFFIGGADHDQMDKMRQFMSQLVVGWDVATVREIVTGVLLGTILGTVAFLLVGVLWQDWRVALAVGVSLFAASSIATAVALVLPWLIDRMGRDPAFGSGPLATVLQDLLTVAIYLATATVLTR